LIVGPPVVSVSMQSRKLSVGSNVTLTCPARGVPQPTITWSKRDGHLPRWVWSTVTHWTRQANDRIRVLQYAWI